MVSSSWARSSGLIKSGGRVAVAGQDDALMLALNPVDGTSERWSRTDLSDSMLMATIVAPLAADVHSSRRSLLAEPDVARVAVAAVGTGLPRRIADGQRSRACSLSWSRRGFWPGLVTLALQGLPRRGLAGAGGVLSGRVLGSGLGSR